MGRISRLRAVQELWGQALDGPASHSLAQTTQPRRREPSQRAASEKVGKLDQNRVGCQERLPRLLPTPSQSLGPGVKRVLLIDEGDQVARIDQDCRLSHRGRRKGTGRRSDCRRCGHRYQRRLPAQPEWSRGCCLAALQVAASWYWGSPDESSLLPCRHR